MNTLFWMLALAHLMGDYPLQTTWMISVKHTWWGLSLHVGIHLATLLFLAGSSRGILWPYLLALAAIHYIIDYFKNWLKSVRPQWINGPYLFDQFLHLLSIFLIRAWIGATLDPISLAQPLVLSPERMVLLIGLIFCTVIWYISERLLSHATPTYVQEVMTRRWSRLAIRTGLFAFFLGFGRYFAVGTAIPIIFHYVYRSSPYRFRTASSDVVAASASVLFVLLAT